MSRELPLAGRFRRLVATLVDAILVPSLSLVLVMITGVMEDAEDYANLDLMLLWIFLLAIAAYMILNGYTLWHQGQTLGKWLMGIAIVPASSHVQAGFVRVGNEGKSAYVPAPFWKLIFIRALFFPVLFLWVVPWLALLPVLDQALIFGKRRRCLHDLFAGTIVVRV
ncbi:MAG: hypothetical protein HON77_20825 [Gammaproteobacteria bacterium]|nr:hypothetical protein [Gammaproteobacteria bacterium]